MSSFLLQLVSSNVTIILNNSLKNFDGDMARAVIEIINSVIFLVLMPILALNQDS
ncbi:hypothetical protein [Clostridium sp. DJ247]|uniref:hypothetical protein n=1 Tax=Clostridium sp. DJ247 TaxID=2726188 RepID=UPI001627C222|nr:hypothetical protein [Clostridium sp. DJ247]MBC2580164.1 hypothetical protein [Clostridium sp. DJ247]